MEVIYIILLAIVSLVVSVRALECVSKDGVTNSTCNSDVTYCYILSGYQNLQPVAEAGCLASSDNYVCESNPCEYNVESNSYTYCCTTDLCNPQNTGITCVPATTTSTTSTTTTSTSTTSTTSTTTTSTTTTSTSTTSTSTTTTTETPSASSKLFPSDSLICLTTLSVLLIKAFF